MGLEAANVVQVDFGRDLDAEARALRTDRREWKKAWDEEDQARERPKVYGDALPLLPIYRVGKPNVCACCGSTAWWIGITTAECARCGSPMILIKGVDIGFEE